MPARRPGKPPNRCAGREQERDSAAWLREGRTDERGARNREGAAVHRLAGALRRKRGRPLGTFAAPARRRRSSAWRRRRPSNSSAPRRLSRRGDAQRNARRAAVMIFDRRRAAEILLNAIFGEDPGADAATKAGGRRSGERQLETRVVEGIADVLAQTLQAAFAPSRVSISPSRPVRRLPTSICSARAKCRRSWRNTRSRLRGGASRLIVSAADLATPLAEMFAHGPDPERRPSIRNGRGNGEGRHPAKLSLTAILDDFQMSLRRRREVDVGSCCRSPTSATAMSASNASNAAYSCVSSTKATNAMPWKSKTSSPTTRTTNTTSRRDACAGVTSKSYARKVRQTMASITDTDAMFDAAVAAAAAREGRRAQAAPISTRSCRFPSPYRSCSARRRCRCRS